MPVPSRVTNVRIVAGGTPPSPTPTPVLTTVTLNPPTLQVGQVAQATARDQFGVLISGVSWSSSNPALATVHPTSGVITAVAPGTPNIIATHATGTIPTPLPVTAAPIPPLPGTKRLLLSTDLQYLGALRLNDAGIRIDFAVGGMTGRTVNGQVRLFVPGNRVQGDPLYEFSDPGGYAAPTFAPKAPLVRAWGNIYGAARTSWDAGGTPTPIPPGALFPGGYHWSEAKQLLYWTYYNVYNVSGLDDWCLGASRLNADGTSTAYGPWRPSGDDGRGTSSSIRKGPWHCTRVAEHPITGEMLCGATLASGNNKSPWGPEAWATPFPIATTPAGFGTPDLPLAKYLTYYSMFGRINTLTGQWTGALTSCRRPGDYFFEPGYTNTHIDPLLNGGIGTWTELDYWNDLTWIDLPDRYGVLYTGRLASAHEWYSTANQNHINCFHGFPPPVTVTGPVSTDAYPFLAIYDPADLNAVRAGTKQDISVLPTELVNAHTRWGLQTAPITYVGSAKSISGQYFDAASRKLYVCAPDGDIVVPNQYSLPLIHVFQVN